MKPTMMVFVDALRPEALDHMDFVKTLTRRRIKAELGFSSTCHASIYTGVHANKHLHWFIWQRAPANSPFTFLRKTGISRLPGNIYTRYGWYCLACLLKARTVPYGFLSFHRVPMDYWSDFALAWVDFEREPQPMLGSYPTFFQILKDHRLPYEIIGMTRKAHESATTMSRHKLTEIKPLTYYFLGDIDPLSHRYGPDSPEVITRVRHIDKVVEQKYAEMSRRCPDFRFVLFSDHGQTVVTERVNLDSYFTRQGKDINNYVHFIDACYARFWFRTDKERAEVESVLSTAADKGYVLPDEVLVKYHAKMPDNRYGDLVYHLKSPLLFDIANPKTTAMHGYLPDEPGADGIFVTNQPLSERPYVDLVDIMPSVMTSMGLAVPDYVDGVSLWKT